MARFDSSDRLDAGLRFDAVPAPPVARTQPSRRMNFFKLELKGKTPEEKINMLKAHIAAMALPDALVKFPAASRKPSDAQVAAILSALEDAKAAADAAETAWKAANATRDDVEDQADVILTARANDCEATTQVLAELTLAGLPMRGGPAPAGPLGAPQNLRATMGDMGGDIDLMWEPNKKARSAQGRFKVHLAAGDYTAMDPTTKSKTTQSGLTPGTTYAFQVRFVGPDGPGPWSDEVVKMAP